MFWRAKLTVQMANKNEAQSRIESDAHERQSICMQLNLCIHSLWPDEHNTESLLIFIIGEEILNPGINVYNKV